MPTRGWGQPVWGRTVGSPADYDMPKNQVSGFALSVFGRTIPWALSCTRFQHGHRPIMDSSGTTIFSAVLGGVLLIVLSVLYLAEIDGARQKRLQRRVNVRLGGPPLAHMAFADRIRSTQSSSRPASAASTGVPFSHTNPLRSSGLPISTPDSELSRRTSSGRNSVRRLSPAQRVSPVVTKSRIPHSPRGVSVDGAASPGFVDSPRSRSPERTGTGKQRLGSSAERASA
jgi:hypothetical protein